MPDDEIDFGVGALRHKANKRKDSAGVSPNLENAEDRYAANLSRIGLSGVYIAFVACNLQRERW